MRTVASARGVELSVKNPLRTRTRGATVSHVPTRVAARSQATSKKGDVRSRRKRKAPGARASARSSRNAANRARRYVSVLLRNWVLIVLTLLALLGGILALVLFLWPCAARRVPTRQIIVDRLELQQTVSTAMCSVGDNDTKAAGCYDPNYFAPSNRTVCGPTTCFDDQGGLVHQKEKCARECGNQDCIERSVDSTTGENVCSRFQTYCVQQRQQACTVSTVCMATNNSGAFRAQACEPLSVEYCINPLTKARTVRPQNRSTCEPVKVCRYCVDNGTQEKFKSPCVAGQREVEQAPGLNGYCPSVTERADFDGVVLLDYSQSLFVRNWAETCSCRPFWQYKNKSYYGCAETSDSVGEPWCRTFEQSSYNHCPGGSTSVKNQGVANQYSPYIYCPGQSTSAGPGGGINGTNYWTSEVDLTTGVLVDYLHEKLARANNAQFQLGATAWSDELVDVNQSSWGFYVPIMSKVMPIELTTCVGEPDQGLPEKCGAGKVPLNATLSAWRGAIPISKTFFAPPLSWCANEIRKRGSNATNRFQTCILVTDGANENVEANGQCADNPSNDPHCPEFCAENGIPNSTCGVQEIVNVMKQTLNITIIGIYIDVEQNISSANAKNLFCYSSCNMRYKNITECKERTEIQDLQNCSYLLEGSFRNQNALKQKLGLVVDEISATVTSKLSVNMASISATEETETITVEKVTGEQRVNSVFNATTAVTSGTVTEGCNDPVHFWLLVFVIPLVTYLLYFPFKRRMDRRKDHMRGLLQARKRLIAQARKETMRTMSVSKSMANMDVHVKRHTVAYATAKPEEVDEPALPATPAEPEDPKWETFYTDDGTPYYRHRRTGDVKWEKKRTKMVTVRKKREPEKTEPPAKKAPPRKKYKWEVKANTHYLWASHNHGGIMKVDFGKVKRAPPSAPGKRVRKVNSWVEEEVEVDISSSDEEEEIGETNKGREVKDEPEVLFDKETGILIDETIVDSVMSEIETADTQEKRDKLEKELQEAEALEAAGLLREDGLFWLSCCKCCVDGLGRGEVGDDEEEEEGDDVAEPLQNVDIGTLPGKSGGATTASASPVRRRLDLKPKQAGGSRSSGKEHYHKYKTEDGVPYYYSRKRGETAWQLPPNGVVVAEEDEYETYYLENGTPYYLNKVTGETVWKKNTTKFNPAV